jgi:hypothetical protein
MISETPGLLITLEEALKADDWSGAAYKTIESIVELLNDREMNDEEYKRYSLLLRKF